MASHRLIQAISRGTAAALLWGLLSALVTRALMRAVALVANEEPEFHWAGLAFIAGLYIATLLPGAVALAYSTARWPWILFGGGVAFLAYGAVVIGGAETANAHDMTAWRWVLLFSLLAAMLAVYAAQVVLVYRSSRPGRTSRTRSVA